MCASAQRSSENETLEIGALPSETLRLFPESSTNDSLARLPADFVIGRLLEEGDSEDLRWLLDRVSKNAITDWLDRRGPRQLSRRSRAFWAMLLEHPIGDPSPIDEELWPL